jgi:disulfide bond formation protein DsbB
MDYPRMSTTLASLRPVPAAATIAVVGAAAILGAYFFEFVLKLPPCPLCLDQRIPYYIAIPLALVVAWGAAQGAPRGFVRVGFVLLAIAMVVGAGVGIYHAGIEWKFWPGPSECSGPLPSLGGGGGLLQQMETTRVVRCDEAAWRLFGLSLAGYNALISGAMAALSFAAARKV